MRQPAPESGLHWVTGLAWAFQFCLAAGICVGSLPEAWWTNLTQIVIFTLAGLTLWTVPALRPSRRLLFFLGLLCVPPGLGLLQIWRGWSAYRWATEVATLDWFTRLVAFWLGAQLYRGAAERGRAVAAWMVLASFLSVWALVGRMHPGAGIARRWNPGAQMGPFTYANEYAWFAETLFPGALLAMAVSSRLRGFYGLAAALLAAGVVASASRMGAFLLLVEMVIIAALLSRQRGPVRTRKTLLLFWLSLAGPLTVAVGWSPLLRELTRPDPLGDRKQLILATLQMAVDRPLLGWGLGTWAIVYPAYARFDDGLEDHQAHCDWAQWAAEGGFLLVSAMVAFLVGLVGAARKNYWGLGLVAAMIHGVVDYPFIHSRPGFGYYFFGLAGMLASARADNEAPGGELAVTHRS